MIVEAINDYKQQKKYDNFNLKAIFFDMDGVLFDSMKFHASAWVNALRDVNIPFTIYEAYMNEGRTGHSTIDGAFQKTMGRNATEEEKINIYKLKSKYFEANPPMPKMEWVTELIQKIKNQGLSIYLVTGSGQPTLIDSLQHNFPNVFVKARMVTAFDVENGKPHPEPYLKALKKSGLQPSEIAVIENAPLGIESAVAAGLFTIAVNTGPLAPEVLENYGANIVFNNMKELHDSWELFF